MYRDTVTLFNRYTDNGTLKWRAIVFNGTDFNADKSAILATYGENCNDRAKWHLRTHGDADSGIFVDAMEYKRPHEYTGADGTFALRSGNDFDFFALGDHYSATAYSDDDYLDGFYNYFNAAHDDVFVVSNVAVYSVIPHIEVTGR